MIHINRKWNGSIEEDDNNNNKRLGITRTAMICMRITVDPPEARELRIRNSLSLILGINFFNSVVSVRRVLCELFLVLQALEVSFMCVTWR